MRTSRSHPQRLSRVPVTHRPIRPRPEPARWPGESRHWIRSRFTIARDRRGGAQCSRAANGLDRDVPILVTHQSRQLRGIGCREPFRRGLQRCAQPGFANPAHPGKDRRERCGSQLIEQRDQIFLRGDLVRLVERLRAAARAPLARSTGPGYARGEPAAPARLAPRGWRRRRLPGQGMRLCGTARPKGSAASCCRGDARLPRGRWDPIVLRRCRVERPRRSVGGRRSTPSRPPS